MREKELTENGRDLVMVMLQLFPLLPREVQRHIVGYAQAIVDFDLHLKEA